MCTERSGTLLASIAVLVVFWGAIGLFQTGSTGRSGYSTVLGVFVNQVEEGGPADRAGLEVGDRITGVEGRPFSTPWRRPHLSRVGVGNIQALIAERGNDVLEVPVTWEAPSREHWRSLLMDFLVTAAFLGFGLWAFLVSRAPAGLILALFGIFYAVTNFQGPVVDTLDEGVRYLQQNLSIFYTALLLHFFVVFPKPKSVFSRRIPGWMVYLPFLPFFTFGLAEWVVYPSGLRGYRSVAGFTDLFYMLLALVALIHTAATQKKEERRESGFNLVLWGVAISFGPPLVLGVLSTVVPGFAVPGGEFLTLLGIAIPGSMALAVIVGVRRAAERGL